MQFFLTYTLGLRPTPENGWVIPKPQMKADKGSIVHKALELLAASKLAVQEGRASFADAETGGSWPAAGFEVDEAFETSWRHYTTKLTHWDWKPADYRDCRTWTLTALSFNGGRFNPLFREVICPEKHFDFTFDEPWAAYAYRLPDGSMLEGRLAMKGTIDLVARVDEDPRCIELVDWKTGERKDWSTGKLKDYESLREDSQLRMYHYALSRLFPEAREILITIVFIRSGGPFSLPFSREDLPETERMIRRRFETIRDCQHPPRIKGDRTHGWKCGKLCTFGMSAWAGGRGETVCDHLHDEVLSLGLDRVTAKYGSRAALTSYGEGGGQTTREENP